MAIAEILSSFFLPFFKQLGILFVIAFLWKCVVKSHFYIWSREAAVSLLFAEEEKGDTPAFYFLALVSLYVASELRFSEQSMPSQSFARELFYGAVLFVGVAVCFLCNRRGDGKKFLDRFFILSLPAFLRMQLVSFLMVLITSLLIFSDRTFFDNHPKISSSVNFLIDLPAYLYGFWFVIGGIRRIEKSGISSQRI